MTEGHVVGTISIKVTPDTSTFRRELHAELAAIEREEEAKIKVKADFDKNGLKEKVKAAAEESDATAHVKVDVDRRGDVIHDLDNVTRRVQQRLDASPTRIRLGVSPEEEYRIMTRLRKLKPQIEPEISQSFLTRLANRIPLPPPPRGGFGGFRLGSIGNFGDPANLIAILTLLPPALAILAPALVSLPALISAVAAPIGVLALGMDGLKKAAEGAGLATTDKKGKLKVGPALKQITDGVSDVFAKGLTPVLQQLLTAAKPVTTAMRGVAEGLVNIFSSVAKTLTSPAIVNQLNTLFANIGGLLSAAAPGISAFVTGFVNLAAQVSTHFPGLANWFNDLGNKFSDWVTKITKDGSLDRAISSMRPILDEIIGFVGKLVDAGIKLAADPQMGQSIHNVLDGLSNFIINALPDLTNFFNSLAPILGLIGKGGAGKNSALNPGGGDSTHNGQGDRVYGKIGDGNIFPGFRAEALHNLKNLLSFTNPALMIADLFDDDSAVATVAAKIGGFLSKAFDLVAQGIGTTAAGLWQAITASADSALQGLTSTLAGIWNTISSQASTAWNAVSGVVSSAVNGIVGFVLSIPGQIAGIWNSIVSAAKSAWDGIVNAASTAVNQVVSFFQSLPGKIIGILSGLGGQLFSAGANAMGQLAAGVQSAVGKVTSAVSGALSGVLSLIPHSPAPEGPFSSPGWNQLFTGGQAIGNQFQTGLESGFQGVIKSATDLLAQVHGALANGVLPPGLKQNVAAELKAIGQEYDQLKVQRDQLDPKDKAGRKAISDQMKQLQTLRDQLKLDQDQFPGGKKNDPNNMNIGQMFGQQLQKLPGIGTNFAMANINQFEQDLGISGKGAIPTIANIGIQWASSALSKQIGNAFGNQGLKPGGDVHIHVQSVDEAMAVHQAERNRQAMTYAGR